MTFIGFLRAELAPTPGRARAAARLTVAALLGSLLVLSFHIPHGLWVVFTIFILSQANAGASLERGLQRIAGTVVGAVAAMAAFPLIVGAPWCEIPLVAIGTGLALFLSRTTSAPYATFLAGLTFAILLRDLGPQERVGIEALWRFATIVLGIVVGTTAQMILWPDDPENVLLDDLAGELDRVRTIVETLAARTAPSETRRDSIPAGHLGRHLTLVANAEVRHPSLRHRHSDLIALVVQVDWLLSSAIWLERTVDGQLPGAVIAMLQATAAECRHIGQALAEHRAPVATPTTLPGRDEALAAASPAIFPALVELDRALGGVCAHLSFLMPDADGRPSGLDAVEPRPFLSPACSLSNRVALLYALKGSLAVSLCWVLVTALDWPGIWTCVLTCIIVAESTVGASLRKALLRVCGATFGALMAGATVLIVMPLTNDISMFLAVLAVCFGIAAWVAVGGPRISYMGIQIAYATAMCLLIEFGPRTNLISGRDRIIGILIGIGVMAMVNFVISPTFAVSQMRRHAAATLRHIAGLCRVGIEGPTGVLARPKGLRQAVYEELITVGRLDEEAESEPQAHDPGVLSERRILLAIAADLREALPGFFTLAHHWLDNDLREAISETGMTRLNRFALAIAETLDAMADEVENVGHTHRPDLASELAAAETALDEILSPDEVLPDGRPASTHVATRLALCRALLPTIQTLAADVESLTTRSSR